MRWLYPAYSAVEVILNRYAHTLPTGERETADRVCN